MQLSVIKNIIGKIAAWALKHKLYALIILAVIGGAGYFGYQKLFTAPVTVRYVTATAEKGVLASSISGTGQVSASNEVAISTKASGDVIYVGAKIGDTVKAGALLVSVNASEALKSVRDAETSLETARLSLQKLEAPAEALTLLQAEHSLAAAQESQTDAEASLAKSYEDGFNTVTNAFLDLPTIMTGMQSLLYGKDFNTSMDNTDWYLNQGVSYNFDEYNKLIQFHDGVSTDYQNARISFNLSFEKYKAASRSSATSTIEALILDTYETAKVIADLVKNANNYLDLVQDSMEQYQYKISIPAQMTTHQNSLNSYIGTTNSHLSSLLSIKNSIENYKNSIVSAGRTIAEKTASLADLQSGADPLDLRSAQISVQQKENALADAREKLAEYSARAKFDGVVAALTVKKGDSISAGASLGTLITEQRIATIALNEVDVAKVKVGQKATLTFDAVDDLNITGEVAEVDALGTTSQGVVSYNVKIAFDVQDERIKSGMTVSANIILSSKPDVLLVSSAAVKTQGGASYVEVLANGVPEKKTVTVGESNDTMTEIVSGLEVGEEVITQKITSSGTSAASSASTNGNSTRAMQGMFMGGPR